jgi:hypothetical protein
MGWVKLDDGFLDHPKFLKAGPLAGYLALAGLAWANRNLTDGHIPREQVPRLVNFGGLENVSALTDPLSLACHLTNVGLWEETTDGWVIHDYTEWQRSAEEIKYLSQIRAEAGARGGAKPKQKLSKTEANGKQLAKQNGSKNQAEEEQDLTPCSPPDGGIEKRREEVEFEEWIQHHELTTGHKPPKPGTKGRRALAESFHARRAEGLTLEEMKLATVGAHADDYRRSNGYDVATSILRPTKIADLVAKGRLRAPQKPTLVADRLEARFGNGKAAA